MSCKVPKAVKDVRALFEQQGIELSGENLKKHLTSQQFTLLRKSFYHHHQHQSPESKLGYKILDSRFVRRDWIAQWVMDLEVGSSKGFSKGCSLGKEGHQQYLYVKEMILKSTGTTQQAGVETSCELTPGSSDTSSCRHGAPLER